MARTGYNVTETKKLMGRIEECYNTLGTTVQTNWENVVTTLQANWVGEDEQDYEVKLADRISKMYVNAYTFADNALTALFDLAKGWHKFQQDNKLEQGPSAEASSFGLEKVELVKNETIIEAKKINITDDMDRGLVNDGSKEAIVGALENYKNSIRTSISEMIDSVSVSEAFFGEQTDAIKKFVDKIGSALGEVVTAVKDLYDRLEELANANYTTASSEASETFTTNQSTVESDLTKLESSRWTE